MTAILLSPLLMFVMYTLVILATIAIVAVLGGVAWFYWARIAAEVDMMRQFGPIRTIAKATERLTQVTITVMEPILQSNTLHMLILAEDRFAGSYTPGVRRFERATFARHTPVIAVYTDVNGVNNAAVLTKLHEHAGENLRHVEHVKWYRLTKSIHEVVMPSDVVDMPAFAGDQRLLSFFKELPTDGTIYDFDDAPVGECVEHDNRDCTTFGSWMARLGRFNRRAVGRMGWGAVRWQWKCSLAMSGKYDHILRTATPGSEYYIISSSVMRTSHCVIVFNDTWTLSKIGSGGGVALMTPRDIVDVYGFGPDANMYLASAHASESEHEITPEPPRVVRRSTRMRAQVNK